ncbi:MAG: DUF429 domain-containing protein [Alkalispirochaeta sp.]
MPAVVPALVPAEPVRIIGWDAAVDPRNTALTLVTWSGAGSRPEPALEVEALGVAALEVAGLEVLAQAAPRDHEELIATVSDWMHGDTPTLLCVDSPLGWPKRMAEALAVHVAGAGIDLSADELFRRVTDIDVRRRVGKTPLDVGADRIARTALATLNAIAALQERVGRIGRTIDTPTILEDPRRDPEKVLLLESYPAGWFASERIATGGYRPREATDRRRVLLDQVEQRLRSGGVELTYGAQVDRERFTRRADDLDALICTLNGVDYLLGRCPAPAVDQQEIARREGWIWCKDRS